MTVQKTEDHLTAERRLDEAKARVAAALQAHQAGVKEFHDAKAKRDELLAATGTGKPVSSAAIKEVEDTLRDVESRLAFHKAGLDGAKRAQAAALDQLRPFERRHFEARHRELNETRTKLCMEADALIEQARAKLDEIAALAPGYHQIKNDAMSSECHPHVAGFGDPWLPAPRISKKILVSATYDAGGQYVLVNSVRRELGA